MYHRHKYFMIPFDPKVVYAYDTSLFYRFECCRCDQQLTVSKQVLKHLITGGCELCPTQPVVRGIHSWL